MNRDVARQRCEAPGFTLEMRANQWCGSKQTGSRGRRSRGEERATTIDGLEKERRRKRLLGSMEKRRWREVSGVYMVFVFLSWGCGAIGRLRLRLSGSNDTKLDHSYGIFHTKPPRKHVQDAHHPAQRIHIGTKSDPCPFPVDSPLPPFYSCLVPF